MKKRVSAVVCWHESEKKLFLLVRGTHVQCSSAGGSRSLIRSHSRRDDIVTAATVACTRIMRPLGSSVHRNRRQNVVNRPLAAVCDCWWVCQGRLPEIRPPAASGKVMRLRGLRCALMKTLRAMRNGVISLLYLHTTQKIRL